MSQHLASLFADPLDKEVRRHFDRCWKAMWRDLDYLALHNEQLMSDAQANGWTIERLRVVAVLSAFNRIVVGPLTAAYGTPTRAGLGQETAILFGSHVEVSAATAAKVRPALTAFEHLTHSNALKAFWLNISRTSDLVWAMARDDADPDGGEDGETADD